MAALRDWTERMFDNIGLKEWNYDRLKQSEIPEHEQDDDDQDTPRPDPSAVQSLLLKVGAAVLLVAVLLFAISRSSWTPPRGMTVAELPEADELRQSYLHVLFPANDTSIELCKTTFSAAALHYSTPRVLGWHAAHEVTGKDDNSAVLFYVRNVLSWVNQLSNVSDHELILILDTNDVWFQQRPHTLISKYHAINARAQSRIASRLGSEAMKQTNITQTVVFSAQRGCSRDDTNAIDCYAVPPSDLRGTKYGDTRATTDLPRHLNTGSVMGPVGDVKALFKHALKKLEKDSKAPHTYKTAQDVFARIFGEQSYQREVIRSRHITWWAKFISFFGRDPRDDILSKAYGREQMNGTSEGDVRKRTDEQEFEETPYDFKIGLDYRGEISAPTLAQNDEFAWVEYGSAESISEAQKLAETSRIHSLDVAKEVLESPPPFWTPSYTGWLQLPIKAWSEVPLFTNLFTGVAPVTIHHTVMQGIEQATLNITWKDTWFSSHLRPMLIAKGTAARTAIAVIDGPMGREEWWNPHEELAGVRIEDGKMPGGWKSWEDLCSNENLAAELFHDGKGPWKTPVYVPDDKAQAHAVLHNWMQKTDGKLILDAI